MGLGLEIAVSFFFAFPPLPLLFYLLLGRGQEFPQACPRACRLGCQLEPGCKKAASLREALETHLAWKGPTPKH